MSANEIKSLILALPEQERVALATWVRTEAVDHDAWDRQMAEDAEAGRLDFLIEEAEAERARGELRDFP